jgi:hypothetical protein
MRHPAAVVPLPYQPELSMLSSADVELPPRGVVQMMGRSDISKGFLTAILAGVFAGAPEVRVVGSGSLGLSASPTQVAYEMLVANLGAEVISAPDWVIMRCNPWHLKIGSTDIKYMGAYESGVSVSHTAQVSVLLSNTTYSTGLRSPEYAALEALDAGSLCIVADFPRRSSWRVGVPKNFVANITTARAASLAKSGQLQAELASVTELVQATLAMSDKHRAEIVRHNHEVMRRECDPAAIAQLYLDCGLS